MDPIPEDARRGLERLIEEDLTGATVTSATVCVDEAGNLEVEELILRRQDRREVAIGLGGRRPGDDRAPVIHVEVYDDPDDGRPRSMHGWRPMMIADDYREDLKDLTREPWRPEPAPVPPTCSHCGEPLQADGNFCPWCGRPLTVKAAAGRLVHLLAEDLGVSPDDPRLLESLARHRKEQPEKWDALVRLLTPGAKA
ncbi:MAG: zinc ribbon domain-containing protein [Methanoculleus marisnigri]|nr:zinc ribbon domain-containing protein [Methanoculleus marisnigri]